MPEGPAEKRSGWGAAAIAIAAIGIAVAAIALFKGDCPCGTPAGQAAASSAPYGEAAPKTTPKIPRLVDLGAGKCVPCKAMAPVLEDLKKSCEGRLAVEFIDVWERQEDAAKYKISVIPTQIFFDASGKELFRHEGFFSKDEILSKWKELGFNL